jgi:hypothetical protein
MKMQTLADPHGKPLAVRLPQSFDTVWRERTAGDSSAHIKFAMLRWAIDCGWIQPDSWEGPLPLREGVPDGPIAVASLYDLPDEPNYFPGWIERPPAKELAK